MHRLCTLQQNPASKKEASASFFHALFTIILKSAHTLPTVPQYFFGILLPVGRERRPAAHPSGSGSGRFKENFSKRSMRGFCRALCGAQLRSRVYDRYCVTESGRPALPHRRTTNSLFPRRRTGKKFLYILLLLFQKTNSGIPAKRVCRCLFNQKIVQECFGSF